MAVTKRKRKLKNGRTKIYYMAEVYNRGVRVERKNFETRAAAYTWHDERTRLYKNPRAIRPAGETVNFKSVVCAYIDYLKPRVREQTFTGLERVFGYFENSPIARWKMSDLSGNHGAIDEVLKWFNGQPFAKTPGRKSFKHELKRLKAVFVWFREYRDATFLMPIQRRHFEAAVIRKAEKRRPDYYIPAEDLQRWLDHMRDKQRHKFGYHVALFMAYTGTRVGEAAGLCWDQVNLEKRFLRIERTAVWKKSGKDKTRIQDVPKTDSSVRTIAVAQPILSLLQELWAEDPLRAPTLALPTEEKNLRPVFKDYRTGYAPTYKQIQNAFNRAFKALGMPFSSTHILRHTNATLCFKELRDISAIQVHLGHGSRSQTERYAKVVALADTRVTDSAITAIGRREL